MIRNNLRFIKDKILCISILLILLCGCDGKSPTAPAPVQPVTLNFYARLESDIATPPPRSVSLRLWNNENKANVLAVKIRANNVPNGAEFRGSLHFEPSFLSLIKEYWAGNYFEQGGALVNYRIYDYSNYTYFNIQRVDAERIGGAYGSGIIVYIKYNIKKSGETRLGWTDGRIYDPSGWRRVVDGDSFYGAKIIITKR